MKAVVVVAIQFIFHEMQGLLDLLGKLIISFKKILVHIVNQ